MIDPELEKRTANCKQMLSDWRQFRDFFNAAIKKQGLTPDREMAFLKVKSSIAMLHEPYLETLKTGHSVAQNIMQIVSRSITLKHVSDLSMAEQKKFEIEWHKAFLQMEETIAGLEEERARVAQITQTQYVRTNVKTRVTRSVQSFLRSTVFKMALVLALVIGLFVAAVIFNLPDTLYKSPSTRKISYLLYAAMRFFDSSVEYRDINPELVPSDLPGNKPGGWENLVTEQSPNLQETLALMQWTVETATLNLAPDLANNKSFVHQTVHLGQIKRRTIQIYYFQMPATKDAEAIMAKLAKFLTDSGKREFDDPDEKTTIVRRINAIVVITDPDPEYRKFIWESVLFITRKQA